MWPLQESPQTHLYDHSKHELPQTDGRQSSANLLGVSSIPMKPSLKPCKKSKRKNNYGYYYYQM
jgi:hypothetical protein